MYNRIIDSYIVLYLQLFIILFHDFSQSFKSINYNSITFNVKIEFSFIQVYCLLYIMRHYSNN